VVRFSYYRHRAAARAGPLTSAVRCHARSARQHHDRIGISMTGLLPARLSSTSRLRARPASRSAAGAVMKALLVASHAITSPVGIVRVKPNDAVSPGPNADPGGSRTK
jgi:hypothetical protein